ncbi:metallophosphoesterase [Arthrobacter sp. MYb211]|uniref:metallophosphoesterase n=1 Tax=unclassified Arthrobacter TaxID=235627 RepID=UPI000CFCAD5E|nr:MULTISPECIES: metallophosphoesterase [unclassified Arthrobacter]PRA11280.1 metallophosphoesterase [Arthrobacter sp. MYb221]PRC07546.1 metallophosphoesterase [Arthrobacter sp. MYb211]
MVEHTNFSSAFGRATGTAALLAGGAVAAGAAVLGYGLYETQKFGLRRETVKVLPRGAGDIRVLHLSDIHMIPGQALKRRWLHRLADERPDYVINTGDNLSHRDGVPALIDALKPLMAFPGAFVPGSNCYYGPRMKNPLRYLSASSGTPNPSSRDKLPFEEMHRAFGSAGWVNMTNRAYSTVLNGIRLDLTGIDDPHLDRDQFAGWPQGSVTGYQAPHVRIALTHAPYQRVLDQLTEAGADIIFAGHTHGGQVCIPGYGALVSNCDLPTWRARGLTEWEYAGHTVPLNVSAGLGHSRFAPFRIACPPEAVLLTLTARD